MKVSELIEKLQELDPELPVWILSEGFESQRCEVTDVDLTRTSFINNGELHVLIQ
jgi:hypothetical protein